MLTDRKMLSQMRKSADPKTKSEETVACLLRAMTDLNDAQKVLSEAEDWADSHSDDVNKLASATQVVKESVAAEWLRWSQINVARGGKS